MLSVGIVCFILGVCYLYFPKVIFRVNSFFRKYLFNDDYILQYRRRVSIVLLLTSILIVYSTFFSSLRKIKFSLSDNRNIKFYTAMQNMYSGKYNKAISIYEGILSQEPNNIKAISKLVYCYYMIGNKEKAKYYLSYGLKIEPHNKELNSLGKTLFGKN
jgi:tetratricopeptide (TPR) repeat protein